MSLLSYFTDLNQDDLHSKDFKCISRLLMKIQRDTGPVAAPYETSHSSNTCIKVSDFKSRQVSIML